jgi:Na+-transporting NADH:ubiquinone oxidoreductase subunit E
MGFGVTFATALTSFTVSLLRNHIPKRIRMIVQVIIIASYVMMIDILIKAVAPDIHRFIGPYVGLIITNCIIMGRAEAFASQNKPLPSLVDGLACGLGYSSSSSPSPSSAKSWASAPSSASPCPPATSGGPVDHHGHAPRRLLHARHPDLVRPRQARQGGGQMTPLADMSLFSSFLLIFVSAAFTDNILLARFLGMCSCLGVSKKVDTSLGLGVAVIFVTASTSALNYLVYQYLLVPLGLEYLRLIVFIVVIAAFTQLVEMIIERVLRKALQLPRHLPAPHHRQLRHPRHLALHAQQALFLPPGLRLRPRRRLRLVPRHHPHRRHPRKINEAALPKGLEGPGITLIIIGIMALAFVGFSGMIKI